MIHANNLQPLTYTSPLPTTIIYIHALYSTVQRLQACMCDETEVDLCQQGVIYICAPYITCHV